MKSYPYVGKFQYAVKLFYAPNKFELLESGNGLSRHESNYTNITHEYLSNTWGVVESKEHAEFIIELAELNGFKYTKNSKECGFFNFGCSGFTFLLTERIASSGCKQITIPLPPKAESKFSGRRSIINPNNIDVKSSAPELPEAGHNLVFASPECKEWPCVDDKVCWGFGEITGVVKCIDGDSCWIASPNGGYVTKKVSALTKPKTPEEALRDDVAQLMADSYANVTEIVKDSSHFNHYARDLMAKYNITPKEV